MAASKPRRTLAAAAVATFRPVQVAVWKVSQPQHLAPDLMLACTSAQRPILRQ